LKMQLKMDGIQEDKFTMLRISIGNHFQALSFHIIGTIFMLIVVYFLNFDQDAITVFSAIWIVYTIPTFYLHTEYWLRNYREEYKVSSSEIAYWSKGKAKRKVVKSEEIQKIIIYRSASLDRGGIQLTPIESYHYARINTKSGEEIIITCLLTPKIEKIFRKLAGVPIERKKRFFCTLSWK